MAARSDNRPLACVAVFLRAFRAIVGVLDAIDVLANPAFGAASAGVITADTITSDTDAAGGTIATATLQTGAGTVIVHTTVGTSGDAINMSGGLVVGAGDTLACSSLTYAAMP